MAQGIFEYNEQKRKQKYKSIKMNPYITSGVDTGISNNERLLVINFV